MSLLKGAAKILAKGTRVVLFKIRIATAAVVIAMILVLAALNGGIIKTTRKEHTVTLQKNLYSIINSVLGNSDSDDSSTNEDLSSLIEIKGDEKSGYYLGFKEDIDDTLQKVLDENENTYAALEVKDVSTLKKFLKAQMVTEYPNLGSSIVGNADTSLDGCLFIGDSTVKGLQLYGRISNDRVEFKGVEDSKPSNWAKDESVNGEPTYSMLPEDSDLINAICVMLGINAPDQIDEMKELLNKLHEKYPEKIIFVQKLWEVNGDSDKNEKIDEFNSEIRKFCSEKDYARFIDVSSNVELEINEELPTKEGYENLAENLAEKIAIENMDEDEKKEKENKFQGAIRIRRVTPNKNIGEYKDTSGVDIEVENQGNTGEGLGEKNEIPSSIKQTIIETYSIPEKSQSALDDMSYLTIPYINFNGDIKQGHMIVKDELADEILAIFQELYNLKYPIENIDIVEEYANEENSENIEAIAIEDNNTYAYYYGSDTAQLTGNALVLNPQINPKVVNGKAEHSNAEKFVDRKKTDNWSAEEKSAYIDKESRAYEIFTKYGWTWGGENENNPNYGYFEKTTTQKTDTEETSIESKVYDLKYVPEDKFNEYIKKNDPEALNVFTLDENMQLTTATWSYTTEEGVKITEGRTINYRNALSKYDMPIEYLLTMLVHTEDKEFCEGLADLAIDSEYIIAIEDKVTTVQTVKTTNTVVKEHNKEDGYVSTVSSNATTETSISETATQTAEVTYVDCWYFRFSKDYSYSTEYLESASSNAQTVNLSGQAGRKIGDFKITAYCSCAKCCGKYSPERGGEGKTSSGTVPQAGLTVASNVLPQGTYVMFNNHVYKVEDTGSGLQGNWIDIYMNSHQEALNWGVKTLPVYSAINVGEDQSNSGAGGASNNIISINIDAMGELSKTQTSNTEGPTTRTIPSLSFNGNYKTETKTVTTKTGTLSYTYNTGEAQRSGNSQEFIDLYKSEKCEHVRNLQYVPWIVESLEENAKTANMVEITEYLFAQATGEKYENSSLVFEEYDPGEFEEASGTSGLDTFLEYLHAWEGNTGVSADGKQYLIGTDGYGNVTVGYGVDIFNGGHANRFAEAGYSTNVGDYVPVEFVDQLEKEEIQSYIDSIKAQTAGLDLTQYQIYALVSRAYNCGISGALGVRNGKNFVQAYNTYWNQKTDDQYKEPPNDGMYNHRLYTLYMSKPNTAKTGGGSVYSKGLENRRKSEWILFKTGYYDKIDKYCSEGNGEFLEIAEQVWREVCTSGKFTKYGGSSIPCKGPTIDCSSFVSWVLYQYGYTEFGGAQVTSQGFKNTNWSKKYGWEEITVGSGENPIDILQPGDIFVRNGSGTHHVTIVAEIQNGKILCYDCGNTSANWNGTDGSPVDKSYFLTKSGEGKIIRVTAP